MKKKNSFLLLSAYHIANEEEKSLTIYYALSVIRLFRKSYLSARLLFL